MPKVDVSKLDAVLTVLRPVLRPVSAPKPRGGLIRVYVHYDAKRSSYTIQVGNRVVKEAQGTILEAGKEGEAQVARLRALGKRASVTVF